MGMAKREEKNIAALKCQSMAFTQCGANTYEDIAE